MAEISIENYLNPIIPIKGAAFDIDGTLIHTDSDALQDFLNPLLLAYNLPQGDYDMNLSIWWNPRRSKLLVERLGLPQENVREFWDAFNTHVTPEMRAEAASLYPGITPDLVGTLRDELIGGMCAITATTGVHAMAVLKKTGIIQYFDPVIALHYKESYAPDENGEFSRVIVEGLERKPHVSSVMYALNRMQIMNPLSLLRVGNDDRDLDLFTGIPGPCVITNYDSIWPYVDFRRNGKKEGKDFVLENQFERILSAVRANRWKHSGEKKYLVD